MAKNYSLEIAEVVRAYKLYRTKCKGLENIALCKLKNTVLTSDYDFIVHCSYIPGDGMSFTIDIGKEELTTSCTEFFHLFKRKKLGDITLADIKEISY